MFVFGRVIVAAMAFLLPLSFASAQVSGGADASAISFEGKADAMRFNYTNWEVNCSISKEGEPRKVCKLQQNQFEQESGRRVLSIELTAFDATKGISGTIALPFGLKLDRGVTLRIDDGPESAVLSYKKCVPEGCYVDLSFQGAMLNALRNPSSNNLVVKAYFEDDKPLDLKIPLQRIGDAYEKMMQLQETEGLQNKSSASAKSAPKK